MAEPFPIVDSAPTINKEVRRAMSHNNKCTRGESRLVIHQLGWMQQGSKLFSAPRLFFDSEAVNRQLKLSELFPHAGMPAKKPVHASDGIVAGLHVPWLE